jgi:hypothetical protein
MWSRRQLAGHKFGRHRLRKDDLRAEIRAIPPSTPIIRLPMRNGHAPVAAYFNVFMNGWQAAMVNEIRKRNEQILLEHERAAGCTATGLATELVNTEQDRMVHGRRLGPELGPKSLTILD